MLNSLSLLGCTMCTILLDFCLFVCLFERAPDIPEMSVPGVGFSFKPKGLAFVTPLYPV